MSSKEIESFLADTIIERPYGFSVGEEHFYLYPVTLGKMFLLQRQVEGLGIDMGILQRDVSVEALRLAREKREECLSVICYHTCRTKEELFDVSLQEQRKSVFRSGLDEEDIAALMITVLTNDRTDQFIKHLGISREQERMRIISEAKRRDDSTVTTGGKSIYGSFICPLLEAGLSWNEIVWERSYTNLRMMLADKPVSIYLTEEERKRIPAWCLGDGKTIKADDPRNREIIRQMNWK